MTRETRMSQAEPIPPETGVAAEPATVQGPEVPEPKPADAEAEFRRSLAGRTPHPWLTPALIGVNIAVYAIMVAKGVNAFDPDVKDLIRWGADYGPKTTGGEWWRLFTCMFLHGGSAHLALNMWVLFRVGCLVERLVGRVGFGVLYILSGLIASLTSLYWHPSVPSVGASGAIFGVCGALLAFLLRGSDIIPVQALKELRNSVVAFVGYNLVFGLIHPGIDMAAHVGGFATGFVFGLVWFNLAPCTHPGGDN
jgi:rhomboid protease GluP